MTTERQLEVAGGRMVRSWDSADGAGAVADSDAPVVIWHHGTPQTGRIIEPVAAVAAARGIRVVSCARAGYLGTTVLESRTVADAAADVVAVAAALGIDRYATVGGSGGGPHALACAALDPQHVAAVVTLAGVAPFADEPWWFDGMAAPGALESARDGGREGRRVYAETAEFDESSFVDTDWQALAEEWSPLGTDAGRASAEAKANGGVPWGEIDDDVAFTRDWGFDLAQVGCPVLVMQGSRDRVIPRTHGEALFPQLVAGEFWLKPTDGHVAVLRGLGVALDWMLEASSR
jgi:pimeloyl-ACP methyl ester carboxylesterase